MFVDLLGNTRIKLAIGIKSGSVGEVRCAEKIADEYYEKGYDAIVIADPWVYGDERELSGLRVFSGCEYEIGDVGEYGKYSVIAAGMTSDPEIPKDWKNMKKTAHAKTAEIIKKVNFHNGFAIICKSNANENIPEDILSLGEELGMEILNAQAENSLGGKAYSGEIVDSLANIGVVFPIIVTGHAEETNDGEKTAAVMVEATDLDMQSIIRSLKAGRFYCSEGPELHLERVAPDKIKIVCSPSEKIEIFSDHTRNSPFVIEGDGIIEADYVIDKCETFVRAQLTDTLGRRAWSNIIKLDGMH